MQGGSLLSISPSFNAYSSGKLAEIAARVVEELRLEPNSGANIYDWAADDPPLLSQETSKTESQELQEDKHVNRDEEQDAEGDDREFEFAFVSKGPESSPSPADEIFYNGQIRPIYPIFDQNLLPQESRATADNSKASMHRRPRLGKLMTEEKEREDARDHMSCSSSEADELDRVSTETYCVWTATTTPSEPAASSRNGCKKSSSTGSSKRWKFRDLLYRSNSDGKDTFVFLAPSKKTEKTTAESSKESGNKLKVHNDERYASGTVAKEEDKGRPSSLLPCKKDLVGLFANVNGLSRSLQPF